VTAEGVFGGPRFQNAVLDLLQWAQTTLLQGLHAIGLAPDVHGQPAWPFAQRLATETLVIDGGLTRQLAVAVAGLSMAVTLVLVGAAWRKGRWPLVAIAIALLLVIPWPARSLVLTNAHATSFHRSPTRFAVGSIERGLALFQAQCASCHGTDGRGEGPLAASLAMWPPRLDGELLWRRAEGELFWRTLHGMHDRHGVETMPSFDGRLDDAQVWALIDGMKAIAAGTGVREEAAWPQPVRAPDAMVRCDDGSPPRLLSSWHGQRLRIVAGGGTQPAPHEDPRLVTIVLRHAGSNASSNAASGCAIDDPDAYAAYAQVSGVAPPDFGGAQLLVDRDGWLRAYGGPHKSAWSQGDLLCRSGDAVPASPVSQDGLGDLIAAIDADPVRSSSLGLAHGR
jgi:mono/diheme cytochrome c family protein